MNSVKSGGRNVNDDGGGPGAKGAKARRARRLPSELVRLPAGADLGLATRLYGADIMWADVEADGSMTVMFPGRAC